MKTRPSTATAPRGTLAIGLTFALVSGLVGCADIWGFDDLTSPGPDSASPVPTTEGGSMLDDGAPDAPPDGPSPIDAGPDSSPDVPDARADAGARDGGDGGGSSDAAADADAADGAAIVRCLACAGCCDSQGVCQGGTSVSACGAGGTACLDCPVAKKCTTLMTSCCSSSNACGCSTAGVTACM